MGRRWKEHLPLQIQMNLRAKSLFCLHPLTNRAVHAAPAADHRAAERFPADWTRFAAVPVDLQKRRVAVLLAFCLQIFLRCDLVLFDKEG